MLNMYDVNGKQLYVVHLDEIPDLPITGEGYVQKQYAGALTQAIATGMIKEPGIYGIEVEFPSTKWSVYQITE